MVRNILEIDEEIGILKFIWKLDQCLTWNYCDVANGGRKKKGKSDLNSGKRKKNTTQQQQQACKNDG